MVERNQRLNIDNSLQKWESPYIDRTGQEPLTELLFLDTDASRVEIQGVSIPPNINEFVEACHKTTADEGHRFGTKGLIEEIGKGRSLWQCGEAIRFHVKITNASRVMTHQLVRARVGVTFSQQCTGDVDSRHTPVVVPTSFLRDSRAFNDFYCNVVKAKVAYRDAVDVARISIQEARYLLPMGLTSFIYMDICLGSLAELYKKRSCTQTQTWEMIVFARNLRAEIERVAPWALPMFQGCEQGKFCWWKGTADTAFANTHLFAPDDKHQDKPYNLNSFVHPHTHDIVSSVDAERLAEVKTDISCARFFIGDSVASKEEYAARKAEYNI